MVQLSIRVVSSRSSAFPPRPHGASRTEWVMSERIDSSISAFSEQPAQSLTWAITSSRTSCTFECSLREVFDECWCDINLVSNLVRTILSPVKLSISMYYFKTCSYYNQSHQSFFSCHENSFSRKISNFIEEEIWAVYHSIYRINRWFHSIISHRVTSK